MEKQYILVMDSGSGGFWTLNEIRKKLPCENYIFFKDVLNLPYGNKTRAKLIYIAINNVKKILSKYCIKLLVIACNTLSCVAYDSLRKEFPFLPIVRIEPYVNNHIVNGGKTLVLATKNTVKYSKLLKRFRRRCFIEGYGDLAKRIDLVKGEYDALQVYLTKKLKKYRKFHIENVVLGCTHYNYIKKQIMIALNSKDLHFFENSKRCANKCKKLLTFLKLAADKKNRGDVIIIKKI